MSEASRKTEKVSQPGKSRRGWKGREQCIFRWEGGEKCFLKKVPTMVKRCSGRKLSLEEAIKKAHPQLG